MTDKKKKKNQFTLTTPESIIEQADKIGKEETIRRLHNIYSLSDDKEIRIKILEYLNRLNDKTHLKEIENYFVSDEEPEVRIEAAKLLAFNYEGNIAIEPLIWVLKNEKKIEIRRTALSLLIPLARKEEFRGYIIDVLKEALMSTDKRIQMDAAESFGMLKESSAIDALIETFKIAEKNVRIKIIQTLEALKARDAIPYLIDNLNLKSLDEWKFTLEALLGLLSRKQLNERLLHKLEELNNKESNYENAEFKQGLIRALGVLGFEDSVPYLIELLKEYHDWLREEALLALDKIDLNWKEKYKAELKQKNINMRLN